MYRFFSFIVIFSFVAAMLYLHQLSSHQHVHSVEGMHVHGVVEIPGTEDKPPAIQGRVIKRHDQTYYIEVELENFSFNPHGIGQESTGYHEGHAHVYLNGEKIKTLSTNRLFLGKLVAGEHHLNITLHANNHAQILYQGEAVSYREVIMVEAD